MISRTLAGASALALLVPLAGCQTPHAQAEPVASSPAAAAAPSPSPSPAPAPAAEPDATPALAVMEAPGDGCAGSLAATAPREVMVGGRAATFTGSRVAFRDADADGKLVLGVLGPINEDSGQNLFVLRRYLQFFKDQKADAIVVSGDVGEVAAGIERAVLAVAASGLPVLVVSGNRECRGDFKKGIARAQRKSPNIVNMNSVRAVEFKEATIVSVPGYHDPNFLACTSGCRYDQKTLDEAIALAREASGPVILLSHGPPKGSSNKALDYAVNGGNAGDPDLNRVIHAASIRFGIFSNIKEAGARATDLEGTTLVPQDRPVRELFLNPGPADTTSWEMNDRTKGYGFAATLTLSGKEASWKLYRSVKLTRDQKLEAKQLDPPRHREEPEEAEGAAAATSP
jgi:Icc-related predicted phosphoesterase